MISSKDMFMDWQAQETAAGDQQVRFELEQLLARLPTTGAGMLKNRKADPVQLMPGPLVTDRHAD